MAAQTSTPRVDFLMHVNNKAVTGSFDIVNLNDTVDQLKQQIETTTTRQAHLYSLYHGGNRVPLVGANTLTVEGVGADTVIYAIPIN